MLCPLGNEESIGSLGGYQRIKVFGDQDTYEVGGKEAKQTQCPFAQHFRPGDTGYFGQVIGVVFLMHIMAGVSLGMQVKVIVIRQGTVSYTHLTLPTSDLV